MCTHYVFIPSDKGGEPDQLLEAVGKILVPVFLRTSERLLQLLSADLGHVSDLQSVVDERLKTQSTRSEEKTIHGGWDIAVVTVAPTPGTTSTSCTHPTITTSHCTCVRERGREEGGRKEREGAGRGGRREEGGRKWGREKAGEEGGRREEGGRKWGRREGGREKTKKQREGKRENSEPDSLVSRHFDQTI